MIRIRAYRFHAEAVRIIVVVSVVDIGFQFLLESKAEFSWKSPIQRIDCLLHHQPCPVVHHHYSPLQLRE